MLEKLESYGITIETLISVVFVIILLVLLYLGRQYIKDSIRELKHVVWPTREETRNYFFIVVITLILFGLYLFTVSTVFTEALFGLKKAVGTPSIGAETTIDPSAFIDKLETPTVEGVELKTAEGEINTVSATGTTN